MPTVLKLSFALVFLMAAPFCRAQDDQTSIALQVSQLISDWNSHEFSNMDRYTTENVEWINIVGMWWKGRQEVKMAHQKIFDSMFKGVPFTRKSLNIRMINADVAIANLVCHVGAFSARRNRPWQQ